MRRKIPAAMGTEQWPLNVQWFSVNTSLVTSVTYFPKGLCTCSIYCSLLFELFIPSKNYFIVRCKYGSLYRVKKQKEKCDKNYFGRKEHFRPLVYSGFEIGFSWVFPTKLVPPSPQK